MSQPSLFEQIVLPLFEEKHEDWLARARSVARDLGRNGAIVTIDMVRDRCPPPQGSDPRVMGAVMKKGEWECVGYVRSSRAQCHNRPIAQMRLSMAS